MVNLSWTSLPASWLIPPRAATDAILPALRSAARWVDSSSCSDSWLTAVPPAMTRARAAILQASGEESGAIRSARESIDLPTALAAMTASPAAMP